MWQSDGRYGLVTRGESANETRAAGVKNANLVGLTPPVRMHDGMCPVLSTLLVRPYRQIMCARLDVTGNQQGK